MTHLDLGLQLSSQVEPLAPDGTPDSGAGSIVLISIGVSNTTQEFAIGASEGVPGTPFKARADADPDKNSQLAIVDGAQGGHAISHWLDTSFSPWVEVANRIAAAGFSPLQVQAAWVKLPERNPTEAFPIDAQTYRDDLETVLRNLKSEYPNIQLAYLSSRVYGGYSVNSPSPEPFAYQMGFGVKLTIQDQINGLGNINPDPAQGEVVAPWVAWGPYIWADGVNPNSDGLTWLCEDFVSDGTHPGGSAVDKVAIRLLDHFKTDPTSCSWFLANGCPTAADDAYSVGEDSILTVVAPGVLLNDSDPDGDPLTALLVSDVSNGGLVLDPGGSFNYTPNVDFNGADSFTYTANDGSTSSNVATVTITVNPVNDAPVAVNDSATTNEDTLVTIGVLANDSDIDGDPLSVTNLTQPVSGPAVLNPDNTITYTPNAKFNGTDGLTYTANDGLLTSNVATVAITVNAAAPTILADTTTFSTEEKGKSGKVKLLLDVNVVAEVVGGQPVAGATVTAEATAPDSTVSTFVGDTDRLGNINFTIVSDDAATGTWTAVVVNIEEPGFVFDPTLGDSTDLIVVGNDAPVVSITNPVDGSNFASGATILFDGTANDTEDGDITSNLVWNSDIDGQIGTAGSFSVILTDGTHIITASVTDSGSASISLTVGTPPPPPPGVSVTSINLNTMQSGTTIDVTITGTGFVDGAEVTFEGGAGPNLTVSNVVVVDANTITATITTKSGGPSKDRVWDVRVTNSDSSTGVLIGGLTVTP